MRTNLPVSNTEVLLGDDSMIVSRTDLKGQITYINRDFLDISGFSEAELIGAPHNLVRHPDMPPEAFSDLWETLQAGRPWMGLVKNRCKNGDYYWVEANVTPIRENGQVTGYLSVRIKPSREAVKAAEEVYRQIRAGGSGAPAVRHGHVIRKGLVEGFKRWLHDAHLATKIGLAMAIAMFVVSGLSSYFIVQRARSALEQQGMAVIGDKVHLARQMVEANALSIRGEATRLNDLFAAQFAGPFSVDAAGDGLPLLKNGALAMNGRFEEVDRFTAASGAVATLFARKGDELLRVTTSLKKENGERAMGTPLSHESPAYARLMAGDRYVGRTVLFGKDYYASYSPIKDGSGKVVGATFIGRDFTAEMSLLKKNLGAVKFGSSGYIYVLDATPGKTVGTLVVHPAKVGANIMAAKDASGREFIREIVEKKDGSIRYPWVNAELGETQARDKVVVFEHFPEWNWVIGGGTYLDEFEHDANALAWMMALSGLMVVMVLTVVMYVLARRQVTRPLEQAITAFNEIAGGNYHAKVDTQRDDEIGKVFQGIKSMQVRLGFEVAETKRIAEENLRVRFGLESVTVPVTLSDDANKLIFMNKAATDLWQGMAGEIGKRIHGFSVQGMLGNKVADYLEDGEVLAAYRAQMDSTRTFDMCLAGRNLRVTASPVHNHDGAYRGRLSQWVDRTAEVAVEAEVSALVDAAGHGDFSRRLELDGKNGFYLRVSEGLNKLMEEVSRGLDDVGRVLNAIAQGILTETVHGEYEGTFGRLVGDTNTTVGRLQEVVGRIKEATEAINQAAREIAQGNSDLSARTEEQASSLEETASSMEQINATVKQNAENARQAKSLAANSHEVVVRSGQMVNEVVETMGGIAASSRKMSDIIGVIDSIAFQTNILALNAAVEAARAGEQGRGFAVVATEVRALAQRSATAAKEIKTLIADSVGRVEGGVRLVQEAGDTMGQVVSSFQKVAALVTEIASASSEQSSGVEQVTLAVGQMDEVTQQNAALVEEAAAAAESLEDQARSLARTVSVFRLAEEDRPALPSTPARSAPPRSAPARLPAKSAGALPRPAASARPVAPVHARAASGGEDEWEEF
ncbi:MAG: Cache 3/Cache 2 fusion domain-containing protein [Rhodocyclaceae bacterium]|nr:Cache 3/Cache 2 fusion domain-containing protein [Rhodocyclaceae bacterium]